MTQPVTQPVTNDQRSKSGLFGGVMALLASYGLCILLLFCLFVLTFFGTLYQVEHGLYVTLKRYFESWFLWTEVGGVSLPIFPGGMTTMVLLSLNMMVGGLIKLRISARNIGVVIIHLGIGFMLLAGLVKQMSSREGHLSLFEGERSNTFDSYQLWEVAIWEVPPPGSDQEVREFLIADEHLTDLVDGRTRTFTSPELPFELVLSDFLPNCDVQPKGPMWQASGPVVDGYGLRALPRDTTAEFNLAGLHAELRDRTAAGERQHGILWGRQQVPWTARAGGKLWAIDLRHTRYEMPFTVHLDDFQKEDHPGTGIPASFRSWVTTLQGDDSERVLIEMNEPLRDGGLVLFQTNWGPQQGGPHPRMYSVFTVVDNPSDKWPEYSLWVITLGLTITFGRKLRGYLRQQAKQRRSAGSAA